MAKTSRTTRSTGTGSGSGSGKGITGQQKEAATKGVVREEFLRKKDELLKLKGLDVFLIKNALGINPKQSDMKPELRDIVQKLKEKSQKF
ncbi:hypothetical protein QUA71_26160 [Microcoleus sp. MON1_C5]|uniref:hypothetical protein n=1 Tax=Microcoleus sp. MON1_C5 TaxID=2818828 RepID=UPI002FD0060B